MLCCAGGHEEAVAELLKAGAKVETCNDNGILLIVMACDKSNKR